MEAASKSVRHGSCMQLPTVNAKIKAADEDRRVATCAAFILAFTVWLIRTQPMDDPWLTDFRVGTCTFFATILVMLCLLEILNSFAVDPIFLQSYVTVPYLNTKQSSRFLKLPF